VGGNAHCSRAIVKGGQRPEDNLVFSIADRPQLIEGKLTSTD
jgi:hypothetical protein